MTLRSDVTAESTASAHLWVQTELGYWLKLYHMSQKVYGAFNRQYGGVPKQRSAALSPALVDSGAVQEGNERLQCGTLRRSKVVLCGKTSEDFCWRIAMKLSFAWLLHQMTILTDTISMRVLHK
jgi:hypothetical protein